MPRGERGHARGAAGAAHGPPQLGGLGRLQPAGTAQLDHLVLEEHHTQRVRQHRLQQLPSGPAAGIGDLLHAATPAQVGLHDAALDGAGPDQGYRHRQVVQGARLQHGQTGAHLGAGLQLEDADRVAGAEGVEHGRVVAGEAVQLQLLAGELGDGGEAALDDGEHAQTQQVNLGQPRQLGSVLVPLDDDAAGHAGALDRRHLAQGPGGEHQPARVLAQVARRAFQATAEVGQPAGQSGQRRKLRQSHMM